MKPIVAIVGRPNVGKSTLFNRLAGERLAIVHDEPGVTRDRHYTDAELHGRELILIDTGGFDPESDDPMRQSIAHQVRLAIDEADVVVCVLDALTPATTADREAVAMLRRSNKPVIWVANKADNPERELQATELYALGIDPLIPVSATHGRGTSELMLAISESLPPLETQMPVSEERELPRVALVGRPNAGKSSLLNRIAGDERVLVDARPGTTRDPIDVEIELGGERLVLVDTAGIRRRSRVERGVEAVAVLRAMRAIERAEVVVLMCDADAGAAEQDARLLGLITERGRAVLIGLNKLDLLDAAGKKRALEQARDTFRFASWAPILPLSALTGRGVPELGQRIVTASREYRKRIPTAALNRFFREVLERRQPPTHGGRAPRVYYITQAEVMPPLFVAMSSFPEAIGDGYRRFVSNQIRTAFGFEAVPLRITFRARSRRARRDAGAPQR